LLEGAVARPDAPLYRLDILDGEERRRLLSGGQDAVTTESHATLPVLFEAPVARTPDGIALVCGDEVLTYAALNERANRLAHYLIRLGVGPECLVGLCLERSAELVVALLAVLKAGAAYLPLDPDYPSARLATMLADAAPLVVLSSTRL